MSTHLGFLQSTGQELILYLLPMFGSYVHKIHCIVSASTLELKTGA